MFIYSYDLRVIYGKIRIAEKKNRSFHRFLTAWTNFPTRTL